MDRRRLQAVHAPAHGHVFLEPDDRLFNQRQLSAAHHRSNPVDRRNAAPYFHHVVGMPNHCVRKTDDPGNVAASHP